MLNVLLILIFSRPFISSLAFPYLNYIYSYLLLLFLIAWCISRRINITKPSGLFYPLGLFCLALILSLIFSSNIANSLKEIYKYACGLLLLLTAISSEEKEKRVILRVMLLSGLIISVLAIYQYFFGFKNLLTYLKQENIDSAFAQDYISRRRVFFPFVTPNILGGYLAMIIPLALISKNRLFFIPALIAALFLSGSLGAIATLVLVALPYLYLKKGFNKRHLIYFLGILIILGVIFISRAAALQLHHHPVFSAIMRLNYWRQTLGIIKLHPLVGVGIGNFNLSYSRYAHNSYLQFWAEMGILGIISILWFIIYAWQAVIKNVPEDDKFNLPLLICVLIFAIHNLVDFSFFLPEVAFIWWAILGLAISRGLKKD